MGYRIKDEEVDILRNNQTLRNLRYAYVWWQKTKTKKVYGILEKQQRIVCLALTGAVRRNKNR